MSRTFGMSSRTCVTFVLIFAALMAALLSVARLADADQMVASWYGPGFEGATTASGEPFDPNDYTAAHKTLPFGTKLIVTYNDHSVVVRINDRGPYVAGRDLDLSQAAAQYIGLTAAGEATVSVETAAPSTPAGPYSAQAAPAPEPQPTQDQRQASQPEPRAGATSNASLAVEPDDSQYATRDQYAARNQYKEPKVAPQAASTPPPPVETAPVAPPPAPDPSRIETPPAELETPNSTVERRVTLLSAKTPQEAPRATPQKTTPPAVQPPAPSTGSEAGVAGITVLPDTGGVSLVALAGGVALLGVGGLLLFRMRR